MHQDAKYLTDNEKTAFSEIKRRVSAIFPIRQYILYGSKARGDATPDSDIDLLIITGRKLSYDESHRLFMKFSRSTLHSERTFRLPMSMRKHGKVNYGNMYRSIKM